MSSITRTAFVKSTSLQALKTKILDKNDRYHAAVRQLLEELSPYTDEQLNRIPAPDSWSAIQTLHHLILVEEYSLAYVHKKLSFGPVEETVDFRTHWRIFVLWLFLGSAWKRQAPTGVNTPHLPVSATLAETRARWERIRQAWNTYLSQLPNVLIDKQVYKQPIVGRLGWIQTITFFHLHFRRHRKQVWRALK